MEDLSKSMLDYLIAVHDLGGDGVSQDSAVRAIDVAASLHVSKVAVTRAMDKLEARECVEAPYYGLIRLTPCGRAAISAFLTRRKDAQRALEASSVCEKDALRNAHAMAHVMDANVLRALCKAVHDER